MDSREAWNFAIGMSRMEGLEPSPEFLEMVEKEIRGEMTTEDIRRELDKKYKKGMS